MSSRKKEKLPFDRRGGVIVQSRYLLESESYLKLSAQAKVLMWLLQVHWKNDEPVDYGIREAERKVPCCNKTAIKAFKELQDGKFISCIDQSFFSSRTKSKTRSWQLLWLPYKGKPSGRNWDAEREAEKEHR